MLALLEYATAQQNPWDDLGDLDKQLRDAHSLERHVRDVAKGSLPKLVLRQVRP